MKSSKSKYIIIVISAVVLLTVCAGAITLFGRNRAVLPGISPTSSPDVQPSLDSAGDSGQNRDDFSLSDGGLDGGTENIQPTMQPPDNALQDTEPAPPTPGPTQPVEQLNVTPSPEQTIDTEFTGQAEVTPLPTQSDDSSEAVTIERITREEAGLDTVPALDFSGFTLNRRIHELLLEDRPYTNEDMKNGIAEPCLITERFQEPIIEDIAIGTALTEVIRILGEPSFQENTTTIYKTEDYYIGFYGTERVELANFVPNLKLLDEDILNNIVTALCVDQMDVMALLADDDTGFFDSAGHIHGGGLYAESPYGIEIVYFDENEIKVHSNFEGNLYDMYYAGEDVSIPYVCFENNDMNVERMQSRFWNYCYLREAFSENGKTSPSGKYIAIYEWITSDHHYFTIRTTDFSAPDYRIAASVDEFEWLNGDYIVYTAMFSSLPAVIRVTDDDSDWEYIQLIPEIDEMEYSYASVDYEFTIDRITEDAIILKDKNAEGEDQVYWGFGYSYDENGRIRIETPDGFILE